MKFTKIATHFSWKDEYALELSGKDNSELFGLEKDYDNLNSKFTSAMILEKALMVRTELQRRNEAVGKLLEEVMF